MGDSNFVVGNSWMKRITSRPDARGRAKTGRAGAGRAGTGAANSGAATRSGARADRPREAGEVAATLAMLRRDAGLTQVELAARLGIGQGDVSRLERRDDMLLSTLSNYLKALQVESVRLCVTREGEEFVLDLPVLGSGD